MKKMRIATAALALAMVVSAAPAGMMMSASAAEAPDSIQMLASSPIREVYGDPYSVYHDKAILNDETGLLVVQNPLQFRRFMKEPQFPFFINYNSQSTEDVGYGVGFFNEYMQYVTDNQDGTYTYTDENGMKYLIQYNPSTRTYTDESGERTLEFGAYGNTITYGYDTIAFDKDTGLVMRIYPTGNEGEGITVYRAGEGEYEGQDIIQIKCKDNSFFHPTYTTDAQGNRRITNLYYYKRYTDGIYFEGTYVSEQNFTITYDENGRIADISNVEEEGRGNTYTFEDNKLVSVYSKVGHGKMDFLYAPTGNFILDAIYTRGY